MNLLTRIAENPFGAVAILAIAAYLEVQGDGFFRSGISGTASPPSKRFTYFLIGAIVLILYSLFLNSSKVDFGKLLGIYVGLFVVMGQVVAKIQFDESPTKPVWVGGSIVVLGGLIMRYWKG